MLHEEFAPASRPRTESLFPSASPLRPVPGFAGHSQLVSLSFPSPAYLRLSRVLSSVHALAPTSPQTHPFPSLPSPPSPSPSPSPCRFPSLSTISIPLPSPLPLILIPSSLSVPRFLSALSHPLIPAPAELLSLLCGSLSLYLSSDSLPITVFPSLAPFRPFLDASRLLSSFHVPSHPFHGFLPIPHPSFTLPSPRLVYPSSIPHRDRAHHLRHISNLTRILSAAVSQTLKSFLGN